MRGMAAPYQSAEIWSVDFQENHKNCCQQMSDIRLKSILPGASTQTKQRERTVTALPGPVAGFKGSYF